MVDDQINSQGSDSADVSFKSTIMKLDFALNVNDNVGLMHVGHITNSGNCIPLKCLDAALENE